MDGQAQNGESQLPVPRADVDFLVRRLASGEADESDYDAIERLSEDEIFRLISQLPARAAMGKKSAPATGVTADKVLGEWLVRRVDAQPILMTYWLETVRDAQQVVAFCKRLLSSNKTELDRKLEVLRYYGAACSSLANILNMFTDFASKSGALRPRKKQSALAPPDFSAAPPALTQVNISVNARGHGTDGKPDNPVCAESAPVIDVDPEKTKKEEGNDV
jgi:hypothetical protein